MGFPLTESQIRKLRRAPVGATGNRLQLAIELAESTQVEMARLAGFSVGYTADVARGRYGDKQSTPVSSAHKFAQVCGCLIEDIFPAREEMSA